MHAMELQGYLYSAINDAIKNFVPYFLCICLAYHGNFQLIIDDFQFCIRVDVRCQKRTAHVDLMYFCIASCLRFACFYLIFGGLHFILRLQDCMLNTVSITAPAESH